MPDDVKTITLTTVADGAALELWNRALDDVVQNIHDPNTEPKFTRRITLDFLFSADEERRTGDVQIKVSTKLAGVRGTRTQVFYGRRHGVPTVVEGPKQEKLFPNPEAKPRLVEAPAAAGGGEGDTA